MKVIKKRNSKPSKRKLLNSPAQVARVARALRSKSDEIVREWTRAVADKESASAPEAKLVDMVNHPPHYTAHPTGVECIDIIEHFTANIANAVKYLWRAGLKNPDPTEDLQKAAWYVAREIARVSKKAPAAVFAYRVVAPKAPGSP
jgi:Protein of unknwon function (DUF3310)